MLALNLLVSNPNPFVLQLADIEMSIFGEGVEYLHDFHFQEIAANNSEWIELGNITTDSTSDFFTAIVARFDSGDQHPGLGGSFDFYVTNIQDASEPGSILLLILGGFIINRTRACRRNLIRLV